MCKYTNSFTNNQNNIEKYYLIPNISELFTICWITNLATNGGKLPDRSL